MVSFIKLHISVTNWTKNDSTSKTWRDRATMYLNRAIETNKNEIQGGNEHQNNTHNTKHTKRKTTKASKMTKIMIMKIKSCTLFETETILAGYFVMTCNKSVEYIKEMNCDQVLSISYNKNEVSQIECVENELLYMFTK